MSLSEIIGGSAGGFVVLLTLIQIVPIKVNPWSRIMRVVGRSLNVEVVEMMDKDRAESARYRIIRFDDELRHSPIHHTEEHFNQIMDDIDLYEKYCRKNPDYPNTKATRAVEYIKKIYDKCREQNDFLI